MQERVAISLGLGASHPGADISDAERQQLIKGKGGIFGTALLALWTSLAFLFAIGVAFGALIVLPWAFLAWAEVLPEYRPTDAEAQRNRIVLIILVVCWLLAGQLFLFRVRAREIKNIVSGRVVREIVSFQSSRFNTTKEKDEFINPGS